jgi:hypothetical protein
MRHLIQEYFEQSFSQHSVSSGYIKHQNYKMKPIFIHMDKNYYSVTAIKRHDCQL